MRIHAEHIHAERIHASPEKHKLEEGAEMLLQFDKRGGLLPVVVQEQATGLILMVGYANYEAVQTTLQKKLATFWSTSRQQLWTKGETSGDYLIIKEILTDCDQDALVYVVEKKTTGVCHTRDQHQAARQTCFYRRVDLETNNLIKIEAFK